MHRLGGLGLSLGLRWWMQRLEYRCYHYDRSVDPALPEFRAPVIFLLWHEYLPTPFYLRRQSGMGILASRHQDAEWLSQMALLNGFGVFRGSSGRGGVGALKAIFSGENFSGLVITPDGPRGPRREMAAGAIFLASKLSVPLVPVGFGYGTAWRNRRTWDQFPVPAPGARTRIILGPRINIPPDINREELEACRLSVQNSLNILTEAAEAWAINNYPLVGATACPALPMAFRTESHR
jgi:hypothetical protein